MSFRNLYNLQFHYFHLLYVPSPISEPKTAAATTYVPTTTTPPPAVYCPPLISSNKHRNTICINCKVRGHTIYRCPHKCPCGQCDKPELCKPNKDQLEEIRKQKLARCKHSLLSPPFIPAVIDSAATGVFLQSSSPISNYIPYRSDDPSSRIAVGN
jgi:hypothetical protein